VIQSILKKPHYYRQGVVEADFAVAELWDQDFSLGAIMKIVCCDDAVWLQSSILRKRLEGNTGRKTGHARHPAMQKLLKRRHCARDKEAFQPDPFEPDLWAEDSSLGSILKILCNHEGVWFPRTARIAILRKIFQNENTAETLKYSRPMTDRIVRYVFAVQVFYRSSSPTGFMWDTTMALIQRFWTLKDSSPLTGDAK
jgi:hypothetical protein